MPDGTTGYLNSNSSIKYNGNFSSDRQVSLTGEAFFDVVKDKRRPFTVNTNEVNVRVLGTRFNIASYENEKDVEVVLEEGKLIFSENGTVKSCFMNPNDLVIYDKTNKILSTEIVEPRNIHHGQKESLFSGMIRLMSLREGWKGGIILILRLKEILTVIQGCVRPSLMKILKKFLVF